VQKITHDRLLSLAIEHNALVEVNVRPGTFLLPDDPRLTIWAYPEPSEADTSGGREDDKRDEEENGTIVEAFGNLVEIGLERTLEADVIFGLQQVADIALRALSPGVNDPNTAIDSLDRIAELLVLMEPTSGVESARLDDAGVMRVLHPEVTWEEMVNAGFMQLRHYSAGDMGAAVAVIRMAGRLRGHVRPVSRPALETVARDMAQSALGTLEIDTDRNFIRRELAALGLET
jgi:uncharacterized membrane protein